MSQKFNAKIALANLYLYHVISHVRGRVVINAKKQTSEPDEKLMREIEDCGGIKEHQCENFRKEIVAQLSFHRMDVLYDKLDLVFDFLVDTEPERMKDWITDYPFILPLDTRE